MNYQDLLDCISSLDYVKDRTQADAMLKAVLGLLASRLDEVTSRKLTERLPPPLTYQKLRSRQARPTPLPASRYAGEIAEQFRLEKDQADELVMTILHTLKAELGPDAWREIEAGLPSDWVEVLEVV